MSHSSIVTVASLNLSDDDSAFCRNVAQAMVQGSGGRHVSVRREIKSELGKALAAEPDPARREAIKRTISESLGWGETGPSEFSLAALNAANSLMVRPDENPRFSLSESMKDKMKAVINETLSALPPRTSESERASIRNQFKKAYYEAAKAVLDSEARTLVTLTKEITKARAALNNLSSTATPAERTEAETALAEAQRAYTERLSRPMSAMMKSITQSANNNGFVKNILTEIELRPRHDSLMEQVDSGQFTQSFMRDATAYFVILQKPSAEAFRTSHAAAITLLKTVVTARAVAEVAPVQAEYDSAMTTYNTARSTYNRVSRTPVENISQLQPHQFAGRMTALTESMTSLLGLRSDETISKRKEDIVNEMKKIQKKIDNPADNPEFNARAGRTRLEYLNERLEIIEAYIDAQSNPGDSAALQKFATAVKTLSVTSAYERLRGAVRDLSVKISAFQDKIGKLPHQIHTESRIRNFKEALNRATASLTLIYKNNPDLKPIARGL